MKRILFVFLFLFALGGGIYGQGKLGFELNEKLKGKELTERSTEQVPLLITGESEEVKEIVRQLGGKVKFATGKYISVSLPISSIKEIQNFSEVSRIDGLLEGRNLNDSVRYYNNVNAVHEGIDGLDRGYKGKGVVVGILDSGIDYTHPNYLDNDGVNRIYSIWDQNLDGVGPEPFNYGFECDSLSIATGTCPSTDYINRTGHGTHVSGIATANNWLRDGKYSGVAPESTIIVVALDYRNFGTSVVDGAKYIYDMADALGMPCVINLSAGSYSGSHDGKDSYTRALEELITERPGQAFTNAAGNGGEFKLHLGYEVGQDTTFTWFRYRGNATRDAAFVVYSDSLDFQNIHFNLQADRTSDFLEIGKTPFYNIEDYAYPADTTVTKIDTVFTSTGTIAGIVNTAIQINDGTYAMLVDINETRSNYFWRFSTTGAGYFDVYSHRSLTGTSTMVDEVPSADVVPEIEHYRFPDLKQNVVGFFNVSDKVLSVGNYISKSTWQNILGETRDFELTIGDLYRTSSKGPSRTGLLKPDLGSTGIVVISSMKLALRDLWVENESPSRAIIEQDSLHYRAGGTSSSAPAVAGGIALLLEKYPDLTWEEIKNSVLQNTRTDEFTGVVPNDDWGMGKFDAFLTITQPYIEGCTNELADNYNPDATVDDGSCVISGCTDPDADNYDPNANTDDGSCFKNGCTDPNAYNYDPTANTDDGSCYAPQNGEDFVLEFFPNPMVSSGIIRYAVPPETTGDLQIKVFNNLGQEVISRDIEGPWGTLSFTKSGSSLSAGLYYVWLVRNGESLNAKKWVIQ